MFYYQRCFLTSKQQQQQQQKEAQKDKGFGDLSESVSYVLETSPSARQLQSSSVHCLSQWWKAFL